MQRQPFEFEDFSWFPDTIRRSMVDYLSFFLSKTQFYKPVVPLIQQCLQQTEGNRIVDLCSGGGGPMLQIADWLNAQVEEPVSIVLTDKYPNTEAYRHISDQSAGVIDYCSEPVDATAVPAAMTGVRTMFSAFHHFTPGAAKAVLTDAVKQKQAIAIFDGGDKNIMTVLGIILLHPIIFFFCTPFFRPFRWSRLVFTYLIPVIPLCTVWDGVASIIRLYTPTQMSKLAHNADDGTYTWATGKLRHPLGFHIAYLIGHPNT
jgi:hypothetical protein